MGRSATSASGASLEDFRTRLPQKNRDGKTGGFWTTFGAPLVILVIFFALYDSQWCWLYLFESVCGWRVWFLNGGSSKFQVVIFAIFWKMVSCKCIFENLEALRLHNKRLRHWRLGKNANFVQQGLGLLKWGFQVGRFGSTDLKVTKYRVWFLGIFSCRLGCFM
jgi:hypothetical protein